jgi:hypothetical protein
LRFPQGKKAQFVTVMGIKFGGQGDNHFSKWLSPVSQGIQIKPQAGFM